MPSVCPGLKVSCGSRQWIESSAPAGAGFRDSGDAAGEVVGYVEDHAVAVGDQAVDGEDLGRDRAARNSNMKPLQKRDRAFHPHAPVAEKAALEADDHFSAAAPSNLFIRQQTAVINAIRAHLAEFGIVAPVGRNGVEALLNVVADTSDKRIPEIARACLVALGAQLRILKTQILEFDRLITAWHRSNETSKRLDEIPGVGPALATALVASVGDPRAFRSGRDFSAWVGLVPKQNSSGGKEKLGSISKRDDRYLRSLFTTGALAVIRYAKLHGAKHRPWLTALLARRPTKVAAIALGNKIARMLDLTIIPVTPLAAGEAGIIGRATCALGKQQLGTNFNSRTWTDADSTRSAPVLR
jgi:hypothetical protein